MKRWPLGRIMLISLLVSCLLLPLTSGSLAVPDASDRPLAAAPPPTEYEVEIACQKAVYIDEQNPVTNNNGALQGDYLRVGTGPEFCGDQWALLDIGPITETDGGPLPDDADVTGAQLKLYKESGTTGSVKAYGINGDFNEGTVNWNTQPNLYNSPTATTSVTSGDGWKYLNIPIFTLNDAINYHHGVRLAIRPTWTDCSHSLGFYSDDHSYQPRLVISYLGEEPEPTPPPPEPTVEDNLSCEIDISWTPTHPAPGEMVTITATAVDNVAMRYVAINRGSVQLARRDATSGKTEISVSYTEEAVLPSLSYLVVADDLSVEADRVLEEVTIPVVGTGTAPEVSVAAEWEIEEVIPERYRLIREDGQLVTITATATDPEGIDYLTVSANGILHDFPADGATSFSATVDWINDDPGDSTFSYYASAVDMEGNYTSTEAEYFDIAGPGDLRLMATAAPGFHNPSRDRLPWERMVQTFGHGECYWAPDWKSWYALIWYHAGFKSIADGGECFGMSTMASELYQSRIIAHDIEDSATSASRMSYDNTFTKEYVEARQGGQLGEEVAFTRYHQNFVGTSEKLGWIERDLAADVPGVISVREGDGGHAIVPWMSRHMDDGTVRVYVYDCNREGGIVAHRDNGPDDPDFDLHDFEHYPYLEFNGSSWSYLWPDGATWNDKLAYFTYQDACGDMDQNNSLGEARFAPSVTDHDIPSVLQYLFCPIGGDVDVVIEDEDGNMTGIYQGSVVEDIPDSIAIFPMTGPFTNHELYGLPIDQTFKIHVSGNSDDEYVLGLLGGGSLLAIEQKDLSAGSEDVITIEPLADAVGHKMRVKPGQGDSSFNLILAHMFDGYVAATDSDFIGREYVIEEIAATEDSDFSVYVEEGGDSLVVENHSDEDLEFGVSMRSTESLDEVEDVDNMPYIPASTDDDITLGGGQTLTITPDDWRTTEEHGPLHTLSDGQETGPGGSDGGGFPVIPVVIAAAATAAVLGILAKKGIIGKSARAKPSDEG